MKPFAVWGIVSEMMLRNPHFVAATLILFVGINVGMVYWLPLAWKIPSVVFVMVCTYVAVLMGYPLVSDTVRKNISSESINEIIQQLPSSFIIGAKSPQAVLRRVIQLWDDSATMGMVFDHILEGVILISPEGTVLMHNQRAEDLLGPPTSYLLKEWAHHPVPKKALKRAMKGHVFEGSWNVGEKPQRQYLEVVGLPLESGALLVVRDITKIRQLERMRRDFVANISHELRTPITTILMNMEVLIDEQGNNPFVQSIHRNTERLSLLVNALLDLSRIEAGQMELSIQPYLLQPIATNVQSALHTRAGHKEQTIEVEIDSSLEAHVDAQAIEQVLINLVSNACKYSQTGSSIVIRGYLMEKAIWLEVEDDGLGIPQKHQSRLFERFYRVDKGRARDEGGTGLGLAIVRHLVEAMGGEVGVRNAQPQGAVFWMRFPLPDEDE